MIAEAVLDECWEWGGPRDRDGYGRLSGEAAHRVVYEGLVGPIPPGLTIDHLCRNRGCVNPVHLEPVTQRENTLRGHTLQARNAVATHCIHGHAFDEANTYISVRKDGGTSRACRACTRRRAADARRRASPTTPAATEETPDGR